MTPRLSDIPLPPATRDSRCLLRAVTLAFATLGLPAVASAFKVVINEIHYHPSSGGSSREFVEIYNFDSDEVELSGAFLRGGIDYVFPHGTVVPAGGYVLLANDRDALAEAYGLAADAVFGQFAGNLSNDGERVELLSRDGYLISFVEFDDSSPWPETADGLGPTLERVSPIREEADALAWAASIVPGGTPGGPNSAAVAEPSGPADTDDIIAPGADWRFFRGESEPPADWNEIEFDDAAWELGPAGFGFDDGDDATILDDMQGNYTTVYVRREFLIEDPSRVQALRFEISFDDGYVAYLNGVEIGRENAPGPTGSFVAHDDIASEGTVPALVDIVDLGGRLDLLETGPNVLSAIGLNRSVQSGDFSLHPQLEGTIAPDDPDPPPEALTRPRRDVVINEIAPEGNGDGWVELYNPGPDAVDVSGRRLRVFPASQGDYALPADAIIPPNETLVVDEAALGFELEFITVLMFTTSAGAWIDALNPFNTGPGQSTGRYPDGDGNRYLFSAHSRDAANMTDPERRVVINEIQYHPSDMDAGGEWIEFFNRSDEAVDLSGWAIARGINYSFLPGTEIAAGDYLVVASDPAAVEAKHEIAGVLGPYTGRLDNDAETVILRDFLGNVADRVRFADEGSWPPEPDGLGPSAELVHPDLDNRYGPAWRASDGEGTPGAVNSRLAADPTPIVAGVRHAPAVPTPDDSVRVLASVSDDQAVTEATLFYEVDRGPGPFSVDMEDDGVADDGIAGNGIFGATIPPFGDRAIIAFWIRARADGGQETTVPNGAPRPSFLYQVESPESARVRPLYRVVMRDSDLDELESRSVNSNVLLDATFVAAGEAYYNRGIRYRGSSARSCDPLSYRIQFDHDRSFHGIKRLNLNGCNRQRQWIGLDFLRRTGVPTPQSWFRVLSLNGERETRAHLRVEAIDDSFLTRTMPFDDDGNLYRGVSRANFDYRGEDPDDYRQHFQKRTNEALDDYSDVIDICDRMTNSSDEEFPAAVEERVDVRQWANYFAAFALLGSTENSIVLNNGDDYFCYRRFSDDRWILLPWDLDSCFDSETQELFRPRVEAIMRFLRHPRYAPDYWCDVEALLESAFLLDLTNDRIDHLVPLFSENVTGQLRQFAAARRDFISARIQSDLVASVDQGGSICGGTLTRTAGNVSLSGLAPGCGTTEVLVAGLPAGFNPVSNAWSATRDLSEVDLLEIVARYRDGTEVARLEYPVVATGGTTPVPNPISSDTVLTREGSPYRAGSTIVVESGATLSIEPGVEVWFDADAGLEIAGRLLAEGTADEPIRFREDDCGERWEGIAFLGSSSGSRLEHCELTRLTDAQGFSGGVVIDGGEATIVDTAIETTATSSIRVRSDGELSLERSVLESTEDGVRIADAGATITAVAFVDLPGTAVQSSGASEVPLIVRDSSVERCGEGVVGAAQSVECSGVDVHDVTGSAFALRGPGQLTGTRLVVRTAGIGLEVTDTGSAAIDHATFYDVTTGLRADSGGDLNGHSLIVWNSASAQETGGGGTIALSTSNTQGGAAVGPGNIALDPVFVDAPADLRLRFASPCRGTGSDGTDMGAFAYEPLGETHRFTLCDANSDGNVDVSDAIFLLLSLFGDGSAPLCDAAVDCNSDGPTNIADAVFLLDHLFVGAQSPIEPYPACDEVLVESCAVDSCAE